MTDKFRKILEVTIAVLLHIGFVFFGPLIILKILLFILPNIIIQLLAMSMILLLVLCFFLGTFLAGPCLLLYIVFGSDPERTNWLLCALVHTYAFFYIEIPFIQLFW